MQVGQQTTDAEQVNAAQLNAKLLEVLRPYDASSLDHVNGVPGSGNYVVTFWTKDDHIYTALVLCNWRVLWCFRVDRSEPQEYSSLPVELSSVETGNLCRLAMLTLLPYIQGERPIDLNNPGYIAEQQALDALNSAYNKLARSNDLMLWGRYLESDEYTNEVITS